MPPSAVVFPGNPLPGNIEFGIAIARTAGGTHVGICYSFRGHAWVLHLAWHCRLQREPLAGAAVAYGIGAGYLPPVRAPAVLAMFEYVWEKCQTGSIPYGLKYPGAKFRPDGTIEIPSGASGLTCATFVAAVLDAAGVKVIDETTWPEGRAGDREWQQEVVRLLKSHRADPQHVEAVEREIGCARIRPEEIAFSVVADPTERPLTFALVERPAQLLRAMVVANSPVLG